VIFLLLSFASSVLSSFFERTYQSRSPRRYRLPYHATLKSNNANRRTASIKSTTKPGAGGQFTLFHSSNANAERGSWERGTRRNNTTPEMPPLLRPPTNPASRVAVIVQRLNATAWILRVGEIEETSWNDRPIVAEAQALISATPWSSGQS